MSVETLIADGLTRLGQAGRVPEGAPALLARYGARLIEKNKVMNLTAITDPGDVATLHMLDCADYAGEPFCVRCICGARGEDSGAGA